MPSLNMEGPYPLNEKTVDARVVLEEAAGNYALGFVEQGRFFVQYIGRSDTDLNRRIKEHIGEPYSYFMFSCAANAAQAYQKECVNYHDFTDAGNRLDNEIHPSRPEGYPSLRCPRCNT